jgi:hypothetical protein
MRIFDFPKANRCKLKGGRALAPPSSDSLSEPKVSRLSPDNAPPLSIAPFRPSGGAPLPVYVHCSHAA